MQRLHKIYESIKNIDGEILVIIIGIRKKFLVRSILSIAFI